MWDGIIAPLLSTSPISEEKEIRHFNILLFT